VWSYDTNDWQEGNGNVTAADIDANYQAIIDKANNGTFNNVCPMTLSVNSKHYEFTDGAL
jgi:hypothetical protein